MPIRLCAPNSLKMSRIRSDGRHAETYVEKLSKRLLQAIRDVPRDAFVTPQLRPYAYFDVPLPVRLDQNISQPSLIALMIELVDIKETDVVFETGTGAGYQAAISVKTGQIGIQR